ncbi:MAG: response regulator [Elusimicrobia bacterium]|nr:response regulator [Elusimicrobiota bacterium]
MSEKGPLSILVVDDDKNQRSMLAFALSDRGYRVVSVESGALAVESAKKEKFDAAICDIMMPGVNGVAALAQLKKAQPGLKVIMATAYATTALAAASMKGGATGYIAKPYDLKELFAMLDKALAGP